jgi:hypothetical protein
MDFCRITRRSSRLVTCSCVLALTFAAGCNAPGFRRKAPQTKTLTARAVQLPVTFEANVGQQGEDTLFTHRAAWGSVAVKRDRVAFRLPPPVLRNPPKKRDFERPDDPPRPAGVTQTVSLLLPEELSPPGVEGRGKLRARGNFYDGSGRTGARRRITCSAG